MAVRHTGVGKFVVKWLGLESGIGVWDRSTVRVKCRFHCEQVIGALIFYTAYQGALPLSRHAPPFWGIKHLT